MWVERFAPYLGIVGALLLGLFVATFSDTAAILPSPTVSAPNASSTLSARPGFALPSLTLPDIQPKKDVATTSLTSSIKKTTPSTISTQTIAPTPIAVTAPAPLSGNAALDASALSLRLALVNIVCYAQPNSSLRSITGSGVVIDPKGVILTNAHIAQYFLLINRGVSCIIRAGGPATDRYKASLMYISPEWLNANSNVLTEAAPSGTGQYDFAFLAVTSSATPADLPTSFSYVPLAADSPGINTPVAIASYAAQSLGFNQIQSSLFPTTVFGSVKDVFTFAINSIDVIALGGSAAAQEGSSGGGVVNSRNELVGTLTTSTISGAASSRTLDAITTSYIRAEYANETGQSLDSLLSESPAVVAASFAPRMPALEAVITAHLP